jgi:hypothetical protein
MHIRICLADSILSLFKCIFILVNLPRIDIITNCYMGGKKSPWKMIKYQIIKIHTRNLTFYFQTTAETITYSPHNSMTPY